MLVYAITGGIAMGKSVVSSYLESRGEPVIDTDVVARQMVKPGKPALAEIKAEFGDAVVNADGTLNRRALGKLVFANPERRLALERILHPRIRERWLAQVSNLREAAVSRAFVVIPLLYETGADASVDRVICVACRKETQIERLGARGLSKAEALSRVRAQWPVAQKVDSANYCIWTESSVEITQTQAAKILGNLQKEQ